MRINLNRLYPVRRASILSVEARSLGWRFCLGQIDGPHTVQSALLAVEIPRKNCGNSPFVLPPLIDLLEQENETWRDLAPDYVRLKILVVLGDH